ncbi:MAG: pilus assembly protein [Robiginitomaculum sp.]|nr:pilus assembly protein [Robiginitomaculum sp.]
MFNYYLKDKSGNIAVMFALGLMTLMIGAGAAMDLTSMTSKKTTYQGLADAAVLAAARSGETEQNALELIAIDVVGGNNLGGDVLTTTLVLTAEGHAQVTINGTYDTILMGMFGVGAKNVAVVSESPLPSSEPVNIVLVLDTTGSMTFNNKIGSLKTAASDLITFLEAYNNDALKVGVVPFAKYVNIGLSRRNKIWVENTTDYAIPLPDYCYFPVIGQTNCRMEPYAATPPSGPTPAGTCYNDGVSYSCGGSSGSSGSPAGSRQVCDNVYASTQVCTPQVETHTWNGCVGSRLDPWHKRHEYSGSKIPGLMDEPCGSEILALTNNLGNVKTMINAMTVNYSTYIPSGLIWGWRALEPVMPLTEASGAYEAKTQKVMILMTDGVNTLSKNGIMHDGSDYADADLVTKNLCQNINDAKIQVFSIAYEVTDIATKNMLQACATENTMYYDAGDASALQAAFQDIGARILRIRLTH